MEYNLNDIIRMKKPHACQANRWQIIRMGADIKIKCLECSRIVMLQRAKFEKGLKKVIEPAVTPGDVTATEE
ncbi:MAG: DUF951 domain-containing protein [Eubacteriaceae bacterium]|nr:DUF951 domain-containing protein [Eubacteriaceae bacterium]